MRCVETTTSGDGGFDTSQKTIGLGIRAIATGPKARAVFIDPTLVIQKSMIMRPTMTGIVLGHDIKRTTDDDRTIFVTTQIDQIFTNSKNQCHVFNSCLRCC